jgi:hypothetical protein
VRKLFHRMILTLAMNFQPSMDMNSRPKRCTLAAVFKNVSTHSSKVCCTDPAAATVPHTNPAFVRPSPISDPPTHVVLKSQEQPSPKTEALRSGSRQAFRQADGVTPPSNPHPYSPTPSPPLPHRPQPQPHPHHSHSHYHPP